MAERLVNFTTKDWDKMFEYMDDCKANPDKYKFPFFGENEDGEFVSVEIYDDKIVVETTQKNDWIRKNFYWRDGTAEEMFDGSLIREKAEENGTVCPFCGQYIPVKLREKLRNG